MTGHGAHHASLLRDVHGGATRRRRRKRRADEAFHLQILCMIWIIGVIVIESQFFYRSLNILDDVIVMDDPESRRRSMLNSMIEPLKPLPPEDYLTEDQKNRPPRPIGPPPRKEHLLPRLSQWWVLNRAARPFLLHLWVWPRAPSTKMEVGYSCRPGPTPII
mmetsp:Transcript_16625/g.38570  ORF Transcript_16625/g.38570 Transcript_16625/m.38570 type:complete len:162 (-) Transcript_16625:3767-4252(-)